MTDWSKYNDWNDIWQVLYKTYPNLAGHVDIMKVYEDLANALPAFDPEIREYLNFNVKDLKEMADILATTLDKICRVYNRMLENVTIKGVVS